MDNKALPWILQSAEYGISTTNAAHDVNNALAIMMGYTENLEYMLETGEIKTEELNEICEKLFYGIDKLVGYSKFFASERRRLATEKRIENFEDYFGKWIKIMAPIASSRNYSFLFSAGETLEVSFDWSQVNVDLCNLFSQIFDESKSEEVEKIEFQCDQTDAGLVLSFTKPQNFKNFEAPSFQGQVVDISSSETKVEMLFTCFSGVATTKSAA